MVGQRQEVAIELARLAGQHTIHHGFEVVVHHPLRHPTEEVKGAHMGIEHHLPGFSGVGDQEHLAAVGQAEMGQLDGLRYTAQHHMLKAPVELTGIAGGKGERNERLLGARAVAVFPVSDEALHAVIGAGVALGLQAFEQTAGRSPLTLGQVMVGGKPVAQALLPLTQLRPGLALALIARQVGGVEVFLDGVARQIQVTGNSTDALTLN